jgi:hypothetical protein
MRKGAVTSADAAQKLADHFFEAHALMVEAASDVP